MHPIWAIGLACLLQFATIDGLAAQETIGSAASTRNDVTREFSGAASALSEGDQIFRDEIVRTGTESTAKLVFMDSTNLAVGPVSRVKLDRFVYAPQAASQALAVNLTKGVFRFSTGTLAKKAYDIETPAAAIGVRGTVLDIAIEGPRTHVTLIEGHALVCPRKPGQTFAEASRGCWTDPGAKTKSGSQNQCKCTELQQPGQTAVVTSGSTHASYSPVPVDFASACTGDAGLCSASVFADLGTRSGGALCGR